MFACTCSHKYDSHFCECGELMCAECKYGEFNIAFGFHGEPKSTCKGMKK